VTMAGDTLERFFSFFQLRCRSPGICCSLIWSQIGYGLAGSREPSKAPKEILLDRITLRGSIFNHWQKRVISRGIKREMRESYKPNWNNFARIHKYFDISVYKSRKTPFHFELSRDTGKRYFLGGKKNVIIRKDVIFQYSWAQWR
jgi:hypothetical protein